MKLSRILFGIQLGVKVVTELHVDVLSVVKSGSTLLLLRLNFRQTVRHNLLEIFLRNCLVLMLEQTVLDPGFDY